MRGSRLELKHVRVIWKNFSGGPTKYNRLGGERSFNVVIEDGALARELNNAGWNVKELPDRNNPDGPITEWTLKVKVNYDSKGPGPRISRNAGGRELQITEDTVHTLDTLNIVFADLSINPYNWSNASGDSGISGYLSSGYFVVDESVIDREWSNQFVGTEEEVEARFRELINEALKQRGDI